MIEKFFIQQQTLFRIREGILGPHLPAIAKALDEDTIRWLPFACICGLPSTSGCGFKRKASQSPTSAKVRSPATSGDWTGNAPHPRPMVGSRIALLAFIVWSRS
jgi:hypothetical protein